MEEEKEGYDEALLDGGLYRLIGSVSEFPYSVLALEQPEVFFVAGSVKEVIGYSAAEIYNDKRLWLNIIHPDDRQRVLDALGKCRKEGTGFEIEYRIIHKDGSLRYVSDEGEPVFNDKGEITQIEGIITDVGEQRPAGRCAEER